MAPVDKDQTANEDESVMFVAAGFIGLGVIVVIAAYLFGLIQRGGHRRAVLGIPVQGRRDRRRRLFWTGIVVRMC